VERIPSDKASGPSQARSAASLAGGSAPLQRRAGASFGDSPRQLAQERAVEKVQASPKQAAQRQKTSRADGLPDPLRSNMEAMSGVGLGDVRVHRNSDKPAQMQAHAYAQGRDIYLGAGQEKHLPHEAWHVVQQAQGRVKPTRQMKGKAAINDDQALEREADVMGAKAMQLKLAPAQALSAAPRHSGTVQRHAYVILHTDNTDRKTLVAQGDVDEFKNGSTAGNRGWVGVNKYRARYKVEDGTYENKGSVGPLQNAFTTAEAGHVLASRNGGDGGDPENIFAQCGGTNNSTYKAFEGRMRRDLDLYDDDDSVTFVCYLEGDNIYRDYIANTALSDASDIESDFSD